MLRAIFTLFTVIIMTLVISILCVVFGVFGSYSRIINLLAKTWTGSIFWSVSSAPFCRG